MPKFDVSARILLELGSELISSDIIAFFELIKNSFDARKKNGVEVRFNIVLSLSDCFRIKSQFERGVANLETSIKNLKSCLNSDAGEQYDSA